MVLLVHVLKINWINKSFVQFYMLHYQHFSKTEPNENKCTSKFDD